MSLLRTAARASVATRVVGNVQRRQRQQWAAQDAAQAAASVPPPSAPAPAAAVPAVDTQQLIAQLLQLGQLRDAGVLTEAEFTAQKQRLLGS